MALDLNAALGIVTLAMPSAATARSDSGRRDRERIGEAWRVVSAELESRGAAIERVRQLADEAAVEQELLWPGQVIAALDGES